MLKYFAVVVSACCLGAGCVNKHIAAIDRYEVGTKLPAGDIGKTGFRNMPKVSFRYDKHCVFEDGSNDRCEIGVASDREIICIKGKRSFESPEDALDFALEVNDHIVEKYKSGMKDYGAKESKFVCKINADGSNVDYVLKTAKLWALDEEVSGSDE